MSLVRIWVFLPGVLSCVWCFCPRASGLGAVVNEIFPDPPAGYPEFVEIFNPSPRPLSLAQFELTGRISLRFPPDGLLEGHGFWVLTSDADLFHSVYGFPAHGEFVGSLPDDAGTLTLSASGRPVSRAAYTQGADFRAHGGGASLELRSPELDGTAQASWGPSWKMGGTPGRDNSIRLRSDSFAVIPQRSQWRYVKGTDPPSSDPLAWTAVSFDDSVWPAASAPFGYGNLDEKDRSGTILDDMRQNYTGIYLRRSFTLKDPLDLLELLFWVIFDDGFTAYLNGTEILRRNMGEPGSLIPHDGVATGSRHHDEDIPIEVPVDDFADLLVEGQNVLAIHAVNDHIRGSDFLIHPALTVVTSRDERRRIFDIILNEAWIDGDRGVVELFNNGLESADVAGFRLFSSRAVRNPVELPAPAALPPGGFATARVPLDFLHDTISLTDPSGTVLAAAARFPSISPGESAGRFPDGDERLRLLPGPTPHSSNLPPVPGNVVITEIHYHPPDAGDHNEEFVEVLALEEVDLSGWALLGAVRFTFPFGTALAAGEYLVAARDPGALLEKHGPIRVVGPFRGSLANHAETILLFDTHGREVDRVRYADDGVWPGAADGGGPSLELLDPGRENEAGLAWRASLVPGGTPGRENSVVPAASSPIVELVNHDPLVPGPEDPVTVVARASPPGSLLEVIYRLDGEADFTRTRMAAAGALWKAVIPPHPEGSTVEFAVEATLELDGEGERPEVVRYPPYDPGTCLFRVDSGRNSALQRTYRLILRQRDLQELQEDVTSNELHPATFVGLGRAYHDVWIRYRGHGSRHVEPKSYRLRFTDDQPFPEGTTVFLNGFRPHRQVMGMDLWRRAGMYYSRARMVQLFLNGRFFPRYAQMEPVDEDYLARHFGPDGDEGNLYRGQRTADFTYLGEDSQLYREVYQKQTNEETADWSDVIDLCRVFSEASDEAFPAAISSRINVDEWLRWLAVNEILSNQEGGLHRDTGDDYFLYRPRGGKFVLLPWDMDSTFLEPEQRFFRPTIPAIRRLLTHPQFAGRYYGILLEIGENHFTPDAIARQSGLLEGAYKFETIEDFVTFARTRVAFLERSVPSRLTVAVAEGGWGSGGVLYATADTLLLRGLAPATKTAGVFVNGLKATYEPETARWSFQTQARDHQTLLRIIALDTSGEITANRVAVVETLDPHHLVTELPAGRTIWSEKGSPYVLDGRLELREGSELVIEEGARVAVTSDATLHVSGNLRAVGRPENRIAFAPADPTGHWRGILFRDGAGGELAFCDFRAEPGENRPETPGEAFIRVVGAHLVVRSSSFQNLAGVAVEAVDATLEVTDSSFQETGEAIHGVRSNVRALRNLIESVRGNSDAIDLDEDAPGGAGKSRIEANTILGGDDDGIDLLSSTATVTGNLILGCSDRGISVEGEGTPVIERNLVAECTDGIALKDATSASGHHNTVTRCLNGLLALVQNPAGSGATGTFHSSIFWGNDRDIFVDTESRISLDHCLVGPDPDRWGEENFSANPLFVAPRAGDFRLEPSSPCVGSGREGTLIGALGVATLQPPEIVEVEPAVGPVEGGVNVVLHGSGLDGLLEWSIGGRPVEKVTLLATGSVQGIAPPASRAGSAPVEVRTAGGSTRLAGGFRYARHLRRGDVNGDLRVNVTDAVATLRYILGVGPPPLCDEVADADGDFAVKMEDGVFVLRMVFLGGPEPEELFVDCE